MISKLLKLLNGQQTDIGNSRAGVTSSLSWKKFVKVLYYYYYNPKQAPLAAEQVE